MAFTAKVIKTGQVTHPLQRLYIIFYALYPLALSNLLMAPYTTGYGSFNFLSFIPRAIRYAEVPVVFFGYLWSTVYAATRQPGRAGTRIGGLVAGLAVAGALGGLAGAVPWSDTLEGIYIYSLPLLAFVSLRNLAPSNQDFRTWRAIMHVAVFANVIVGLYQIVKFNPLANGDAVNGLMRDAHILGNYLFVYLLLETGYLLSSGKSSRLILLLPGAFVACATFNEKGILFFAVLLSVLFLFSKGLPLRTRVAAVAGIGTVIVLLAHLARDERIRPIRVAAVLSERLQDLGTFQAYRQLKSVFEDHPDALVWGVGAGNYGSSIALRRAVNGEELSPVAEKYNNWLLSISTLRGAYDATSNYFTGLVVEFGGIGLGCFLLGLAAIARGVFRGQRNVTGSAPLCSATVAAMIFLTLNGLVTNVSSWDELPLTAAVMFYAAFLSSGA